MQAIYRIRQGFSNFSTSVSSEDDALAARYLSPTELNLFERMEPTDRRHTIRVLKSLIASGCRDRQMLKAALLHDVGKSRRRIGVFHRTAAVILRAVFGTLPSFLTWIGKQGFWEPFYILENHPRLSAAMLARAGCEERVWRLAELHHTDSKLLGALPDGEWVRAALETLQKADGEN